MTTTGAPPSTTSATSDTPETNIYKYNIILYKKCNQILMLQYIHSIFSIIFVGFIIYIFYTILKNKKTF